MILRVLIYTIFCISSLAAAEPQVKVNVDQNKIYEGDSITLSVVVENGNGYPSVDLASMKDFKVVSGPSQQSNMQWINGVTSSTHTVSYVLIPVRKGNLQIPPLSIGAEGKKYQSKPIKITVFEGGEKIPESSDKGIKKRNYYLETVVDNSTPFRGEQITVTHTLYTQVDISGFDIAKDPRYQGFWAHELYSPQNLQVNEVRRNGEKWYAAIIKKTALFPTVSGTLEIEPMTASVGIRVKDNSQRSFFSNMFSNTKTYTIASNSLEINVRPLPDNAGTVSAAVGSWNLKADLSSSEVKQDEAVTFTIRLTGSGNLQAVNIQNIEFPGSLETFDPKITVNERPNRNKLSGEKIIEYVLIPRAAGKIEIPAATLTYFDPVKEQWRTRKTKRFQINVSPSLRSSDSGIGLTKTEISLMGKDIKFSDHTEPKWQRINTGMISGWVIGVFLLSVFFYISPYFLKFSQDHLSATEGSRRAKKALKKSQFILSQPVDTAVETYSVIQKAVNTFLNEKDNQKLERSTTDIIDRLSSLRIEEDLVQELSDILNRGDAVRFAPVSEGDSKMDLSKIQHLLVKINGLWGSSR